MAEEIGLLDTGATESFIDHKTVARLRLGTQKLVIPRPVFNVDGSANKHGTITHVTHLLVSQGNKKRRVPFYVTNLGSDRFIFGYCYDPPPFFSFPSFAVTPSIPAPSATQPTTAPAVRPPSPMQVDPANVPLPPTAEVTPAHTLQRLPSPPIIAIRQPPLAISTQPSS